MQEKKGFTPIGRHLSSVHKLLSLQGEMWVHPVAGSHPSIEQLEESSQLIGVKMQPMSGLQASLVQRLLSLQAIRLWVQPVDELQLSVVQALLSSQFTVSV